MDVKTIKILFVWTGITGYMADCWRALAVLPGVGLRILISEKHSSERAFDQEKVLRGLDCSVFDAGLPLDEKTVVGRVQPFGPDVIAVVGWHDRLCRLIALHECFREVPKILLCDMPFEWTVRKLIAPVVLRNYLKHFMIAYVNGERAAFYAHWLGFKSGRVERGLVGFDADTLKDVPEKRAMESGRQRRFLFIGRYAKTKRLDVLVSAYEKYRKSVMNPWPLDCYGMGPEGERLKDPEGIKDCGFLQPDRLAEVLQAHDVFVIASDYEPWSVAIGEACASGMPVICTEACGAVVELVRPYYNGLISATGDVTAFAESMIWMHMHQADLQEMGKHGIPFVRPYACAVWAKRTRAIAEKVSAGMR
jgi:glycosyltransferase involved in cell wall biosynthesis